MFEFFGCILHYAKAQQFVFVDDKFHDAQGQETKLFFLTILYSITISMRFTIIAVPPQLMKGSESDVFGSILRFTPIFTNICMMMSEIIPTPISLLYCSLLQLRCVSVYRQRQKYNASSTPLPRNPISSENAAKIKSDCASGIYPNFCNHLPYHCHRNHHQPIAMRACSFCRQICLLCGSTSELKKQVNLSLI